LELSELRQLGVDDLRVKARETREEIFRLRLKLRTSQLDNPATYRRARKELARILTAIREKGLGAEPGAKKGQNAAAG
jgi:large subunit ribosomal protein L29